MKVAILSALLLAGCLETESEPCLPRESLKSAFQFRDVVTFESGFYGKCEGPVIDTIRRCKEMTYIVDAKCETGMAHIWEVKASHLKLKKDDLKENGPVSGVNIYISPRSPDADDVWLRGPGECHLTKYAAAPAHHTDHQEMQKDVVFRVGDFDVYAYLMQYVGEWCQLTVEMGGG